MALSYHGIPQERVYYSLCSTMTVVAHMLVEKGHCELKIQRCWRLYELLRRASNSPDLLIGHASSIGYS